MQANKPSSVLMTIYLSILSPTCLCDLPRTTTGSCLTVLLGLAPNGVFITCSYLHITWALTSRFHPYRKFGGLFSVALSLKLPSPDVIRHFALRSSDFPHKICAVKWLAYFLNITNVL